MKEAKKRTFDLEFH